MLKKVFFAGIAYLAFCVHGFGDSPAGETYGSNREIWVDSVYATLTQEQKIAQLFVAASPSDMPDADRAGIAKLVSELGISGVVLVGNPVASVNQKVNHYQSLSKIPLLIGMASDWDNGLVQESNLPGKLTLEAVTDPQLCYQAGKTMGHVMKRQGVNLGFINLTSVLAPNESYRPGNVFYMKGILDNGLIVCADYVPIRQQVSQWTNHGPSPLSGSPVLPARGRPEPYGIEAPGQQFIGFSNKGLKAGISVQDNGQALFSRFMKGEQLVITDLSANGYETSHRKEKYSKAFRAFIHGSDLLLISGNFPSELKSFKKSLNKYKPGKRKLERTVKKILNTKYELVVATQKGNYPAYVNSANQYQRLRKSLLEKSVTVAKNEQGLLPFRVLDTTNMASITINAPSNSQFVNYLSRYAPIVPYGALNEPNANLGKQLAQFDVVVVGVFGGEDGQLKVDKALIKFLNQLQRKTQVVMAVFGAPNILEGISETEHMVCAYETSLDAQRLLPQVMFGAMPAKGRLPVALQGELSIGQGEDTPVLGRLSYDTPEAVGLNPRILNKIDQVVKEAIHDQAIPGCQVLVARKGRVVFDRAYGYQTYDSLEKVTHETIYDLASITKVASSVQLMMFLEERGMIDLDMKISKYLPELKGTNKSNMIFRDVLTHQAGLLPYLPFWKETTEEGVPSADFYCANPNATFELPVAPGLYGLSSMRDSLWQWAVGSDLRKKTYKRPYDYKYSDMGYYMLQRLAEKQLNQPIEVFLAQNLYEPLGMSATSYLPLCRFPLHKIAPTEYDEYFRNTLVQGWVHDQGAAMFGGVAGHAGLFGTANDLAKLMQMHLQDGEYGGTRYFQKGTVGRFTQQQYKNNRRGLGWDKPLVGAWYGPTSTYASKKTFGHTGFTGTAVWADPEFELIYVFLSNRVYPDATNTKLIKNNIRTRIQDIIYKAMWGYNPPLSNN